MIETYIQYGCSMSITLMVFFACRAIYIRFRYAVLHPVPWSTAVLILYVILGHHPASSFEAENGPLIWLIGPSIVALAFPIWQKRKILRDNWRIFIATTGLSLILALTSTKVLQLAINADMARALAVKSVTVPVALEIARKAHLQSDLVVTAVMISGMFGLWFGPTFLQFIGHGKEKPKAVGLALGCASSGLGTARAFEVDKLAGAFASISMIFTAVAYGVITPLLLSP